jgi:hypothetical protein
MLQMWANPISIAMSSQMSLIQKDDSPLFPFSSVTPRQGPLSQGSIQAMWACHVKGNIVESQENFSWC